MFQCSLHTYIKIYYKKYFNQSRGPYFFNLKLEFIKNEIFYYVIFYYNKILLNQSSQANKQHTIFFFVGIMHKLTKQLNEYSIFNIPHNHKQNKLKRTQLSSDKLSKSKILFLQNSSKDLTAQSKRNKQKQQILDKESSIKPKFIQKQQKHNFIDKVESNNILDQFQLYRPKSSKFLFKKTINSVKTQFNYQNSQKNIKNQQVKPYYKARQENQFLKERLVNPYLKDEQYFGQSTNLQKIKFSFEKSRSRSHSNRSRNVKSPLRRILKSSRSNDNLISPVQKILQIVKEQQKKRQFNIQSQKTIKQLRRYKSLRQLHKTKYHQRTSHQKQINLRENQYNQVIKKQQISKKEIKNLRKIKSQVQIIGIKCKKNNKISNQKVKKYFLLKQSQDISKNNSIKNILNNITKNKMIKSTQKTQESCKNLQSIKMKSIFNINNKKQKNFINSQVSIQSEQQLKDQILFNSSIMDYSDYGIDSNPHQMKWQSQKYIETPQNSKKKSIFMTQNNIIAQKNITPQKQYQISKRQYKSKYFQGEIQSQKSILSIQIQHNQDISAKFYNDSVKLQNDSSSYTQIQQKKSLKSIAQNSSLKSSKKSLKESIKFKKKSILTTLKKDIQIEKKKSMKFIILKQSSKPIQKFIVQKDNKQQKEIVNIQPDHKTIQNNILKIQDNLIKNSINQVQIKKNKKNGSLSHLIQTQSNLMPPNDNKQNSQQFSESKSTLIHKNNTKKMENYQHYRVQITQQKISYSHSKQQSTPLNEISISKRSSQRNSSKVEQKMSQSKPSQESSNLSISGQVSAAKPVSKLPQQSSSSYSQSSKNATLSNGSNPSTPQKQIQLLSSNLNASSNSSYQKDSKVSRLAKMLDSQILKNKKPFIKYSLNDIAHYISEHAYRVQTLCFYVDNTKIIYQQDYQLLKYQLLCFFMIKKYLYQINRVISSLRQNNQSLKQNNHSSLRQNDRSKHNNNKNIQHHQKNQQENQQQYQQQDKNHRKQDKNHQKQHRSYQNVFCLTGIQIDNQLLIQFRQRKQIKQELQILQKQQKATKRQFQDTYQLLKKKYQGYTGFNLNIQKDNYSNHIVSKLGQQLNILYEKWQKNKSHQNDVIAKKLLSKLQKRMIQIIELIFLISQFQGRNIKPCQLVAETLPEFRSYYQKYFQKIIETMQYFDSKPKLIK